MPTPSPNTIPVLPPRPRGRPKSEDVQELEARLLSIARQTFLAHGYGATSMAAIARAARVSKNTLYARFDSKAALFRAIIFDQIGRKAPIQRKAAPQSDKPLRDTLCGYIEHMMRISLSGELRQINRLIYSEAVRFPELGRAAAERMRVGVDQVADHLIEAAARDGMPCRDPHKAAMLFVMMSRGWYDDILLTDRQVGAGEIRAIAGDMTDFFLAGRAGW